MGAGDRLPGGKQGIFMLQCRKEVLHDTMSLLLPCSTCRIVAQSFRRCGRDAVCRQQAVEFKYGSRMGENQAGSFGGVECVLKCEGLLGLDCRYCR